jgi:hypothetical protein
VSEQPTADQSVSNDSLAAMFNAKSRLEMEMGELVGRFLRQHPMLTYSNIEVSYSSYGVRVRVTV